MATTTKELTGRTRYRKGWRRALVLQVEEKVCVASTLYSSSTQEKRWRDATVEDLAEITIRSELKQR